VLSLKVLLEYDLLLKLTFVMQGGRVIHVEQRRPSIVEDPMMAVTILAASSTLNGVLVVVIHHQYWRDKEGGWGVQLVKWVRFIFRKLKCIYFVNDSRHSCSLVGEVIEGCIALRSIYMLVPKCANSHYR
jgi:hypothetical protein